jgi:hypothetical protein
MNYACYHAYARDDPQNNNTYRDALLKGGSLMQQYWLDQWLKIEEDRLSWIRHNNTDLRRASVRGLADAIAADVADAVGSFVLLPSSFIGSARHAMQNYHDSMAVVRKLGKPDFFITMTCNPNWPEVQRELSPGEKPHMRPDLLTRVFRMKFKELLRDLEVGHVLGRHVAHTSVIEFQKRGLPHAHLLLFVADEDKPRTAEDYDRVICAEVPDPVTQTQLHESVTKFNMHGPCGILNERCPCMKDGSCTKRFPKPCFPVSTVTEDSYPVYRRRCRYSYAPANRPAREAEAMQQNHNVAPLHGDNIAAMLDGRDELDDLWQQPADRIINPVWDLPDDDSILRSLSPPVFNTPPVAEPTPVWSLPDDDSILRTPSPPLFNLPQADHVAVDFPPVDEGVIVENYVINEVHNDDAHLPQRPVARQIRTGLEVLDDKWVVPYNPYLTKKYKCHINVEICSTLTSVKYLYKYVFKGQDRASARIVATNNDDQQQPPPVDEISRYKDSR